MHYPRETEKVRDRERLEAVAHLASILTLVEMTPYTRDLELPPTLMAVYIQSHLEQQGRGRTVNVLIDRKAAS